MVTSNKGKALIHKYEQFRNHPYLCPAGVPTIGWGNTRYSDGSRVTLDDAPLTRREGDVLFSLILKRVEEKVSKYVWSCINQDQFDALVSFTYNVGAGNFKNSTLLKKVNADPTDIEEIQKQFKRWNKGGGVVLKGLKKRRNEEAYLYNSEKIWKST